MPKTKQHPVVPEMTRESFESLFGGGFENVTNEAEVRTNGYVTTYKRNDTCICVYVNDSTEFTGATWGDVAQEMGVG